MIDPSAIAEQARNIALTLGALNQIRESLLKRREGARELDQPSFGDDDALDQVIEILGTMVTATTRLTEITAAIADELAEVAQKVADLSD